MVPSGCKELSCPKLSQEGTVSASAESSLCQPGGGESVLDHCRAAASVSEARRSKARRLRVLAFRPCAAGRGDQRQHGPG